MLSRRSRKMLGSCQTTDFQAPHCAHFALRMPRSHHAALTPFGSTWACPSLPVDSCPGPEGCLRLGNSPASHGRTDHERMCRARASLPLTISGCSGGGPGLPRVCASLTCAPPQTCRLTSWACALVAVIPKALAKDHPVPPKGLTNQVSPALPASPPCGGGGEAGRGKPGRNPDVEES